MNVEQILAGISKLSALVIGDICLDRWCTYDPAASEPSRETGIPRLAVVETETTPGAGGTVANNLAALGADRVSVLGVCGDDGHGLELMRALEARGIVTELMTRAPGIPTFTYTKLINQDTGCEDQPRVDFILTRPMPAALERKVLNRLDTAVAAHDVVLVSDQAETEHGGVVTAAVREELGRVARRFPEKVVWVDSRMRPEHFRRVIVKVNEAEAQAACLRLWGETDYRRLWRHIDGPILAVTMGPRGALLIDESGEELAEGRAVANPVDICGAGDAFSAAAALALAATGSPVEAAQFGNLAASITIMKKGTGTASPEEILARA